METKPQIDTKALKQAGVLLGVFALLGILEPLGMGRRCAFAGAFGSIAIIWGGFMGLMAAWLWLSARAKAGRPLRGVEPLVALAAAVGWVVLVARFAASVSDSYGCRI